MIIDCHSHIWSDLAQLGKAKDFSCLTGLSNQTPAQLAISPEKLDASSQPADAVFVLGFVSNYLSASIDNNLIQKYITTHKNKAYGFAGVDPTDTACLDTIAQLKDQGFSGLVLSPPCQNFHPSDSRAMKFYETAARLNMPVYFLYGRRLPQQAVLQYAPPELLDEPAREFPELKMIISHLGYPWIEATFALLAKHKNIYANIAGLADKPWQAYRNLTLAYECDVTDKLLFATGFPASTVKEAVEVLYNTNKVTLDSVLPAVPREQLRSIVERNSLKLLGI